MKFADKLFILGLTMIVLYLLGHINEIGALQGVILLLVAFVPWEKL